MITYLEFRYQDGIFVIHKYYCGRFTMIMEQLLLLMVQELPNSEFDMSTRLIVGTIEKQYTKLDE